MVQEGKNVRALIGCIKGFLVLCAALFCLGSAGSVAHAEESGLSIQITVLDQEVVDGSTVRLPVSGVTVIVKTQAGALIGEFVTEPILGSVSVPVPVKAGYVVEIVTETLPEGVTLIDAEKSSAIITKDAFTTAVKRVTFFTGSNRESGASAFERIAQRFADGVRLGLMIAMCSVGLSLIFGTTGLTNFAHGEMVAFGGLTMFLFNVTLGVPLLIAAPVVIALGGLFGLVINGLIFAKLRTRGIGLVSQLVVSVGLSIMLRNVYLYQFGGRTKPFSDFSLQTAKSFGPISLTPRDLTTAILSLFVLIAVALFLSRSRTGKAVRAVSDNPTLASSTGIDTQKIIRIVWFAGGALATIGGIFRGLDEQVGFDMGSKLIFLMFAGITLGGLGSAYGALIGGFLVGVLVEMASLVVPAELKSAPALFILIVVLIVRPQGILGLKQRVG